MLNSHLACWPEKGNGEFQSLLTCNHFLLVGGLCVYAQSLQSHPTLFDPMGCSPPGSSVHWIPQTRILEWVAMPFSRGSSQPRNWTHVSCSSCTVGRIFYSWAIGEAQQKGEGPPKSCGYKLRMPGKSHLRGPKPGVKLWKSHQHFYSSYSINSPVVLLYVVSVDTVYYVHPFFSWVG